MLKGIANAWPFMVTNTSSNINPTAKRNITDERGALSDILTKWEEDGLDSGKKSFASGLERPDLGDVAMFGVMNSVKGLTSHTDVILKRGGTFGEWYARMSNKIGTAEKVL